MEILDDVHYSVDLIHSLVCYSGYDFISTNETSYGYVILFIQAFILLWPMVLVIIAQSSDLL